MNSDICTVDMENSPQYHRCMSQGGMQTLQQTLSSSACAVALGPGAEDDYDDDENNDDVDDDDYVDNDDDHKMAGWAKCVTADLSARASMNRRKSGPCLHSPAHHVNSL